MLASVCFLSIPLKWQEDRRRYLLLLTTRFEVIAQSPLTNHGEHCQSFVYGCIADLAASQLPLTLLQAAQGKPMVSADQSSVGRNELT